MSSGNKGQRQRKGPYSLGEREARETHLGARVGKGAGVLHREGSVDPQS